MISRRARNVDMREDRKYSLIRPFWFEMVLENANCSWDISFGMLFSNQIRSSRRDAVFWLMIRLCRGVERWVIVGKNPSMFENLSVLEDALSFRLFVIRFSSIARINPRIVTIRAIIFRWVGIVN